MGVGDLPETDNKAAEESQGKIKEMDILIAKTFSTAAGQKVLKHLRDITIERPNLQITEGIAGILAGYVMEGRSSLVRDIEKRIKRAKAS